jgi:DNA-binding transcriptional regulator YiaG
MKITTDHSASSYGIPIILDDGGNPMDSAPGVQAVRRSLGLSQVQLAERCGVTVRAVQSWEQGVRMVTAAPLNVMADLLRKGRRASV